LSISDAGSGVVRLTELGFRFGRGKLIEKRSLEFWTAGNPNTAIDRASTLKPDSQRLLTGWSLDIVLPQDVFWRDSRSARSIRLEVNLVLSPEVSDICLNQGP